MHRSTVLKYSGTDEYAGAAAEDIIVGLPAGARAAARSRAARYHIALHYPGGRSSITIYGNSSEECCVGCVLLGGPATLLLLLLVLGILVAPFCGGYYSAGACALSAGVWSCGAGEGRSPIAQGAL